MIWHIPLENMNPKNLNQFNVTKKAILMKINKLIFDTKIESQSAETEMYHCESGVSSSSLSSFTSSTLKSFEFLNSTQLIVSKDISLTYSHTTEGIELEEFAHFTKL